MIHIGCWNKKLYALNTNGTKNWEFDAGSRIMVTPMIAADGTVYIVSEKKKLFAVNPNGKKWSIDLDVEVEYPLALGPDGTIYITSEWRFYAITPEGKIKWKIRGIGSHRVRDIFVGSFFMPSLSSSRKSLEEPAPTTSARTVYYH